MQRLKDVLNSLLGLLQGRSPARAYVPVPVRVDNRRRR